MKKTQIRLHFETREKLAQLSDQIRIPSGEIARMLIEDGLKKNGVRKILERTQRSA
tara:strand:- start:701 stop:868 length:168 start_codon:yes stop_codon:yes gene_type:complete